LLAVVDGLDTSFCCLDTGNGLLAQYGHFDFVALSLSTCLAVILLLVHLSL
jgi:hypothetical protein